jgi:deoxyribodipyrimidine photo-lyase
MLKRRTSAPAFRQSRARSLYPLDVTSHDLKHLSDRQQLASALQSILPHLPSSDVAQSPIRGGRTAALSVLANVQPKSYARTRNYLDGDVTHLSAYLRHGVLTLAEVRDDILRKVHNPDDAAKLINELAWRDYWQRLYSQIGEAIWDDREPFKTGYRASDYAADLGDDIPSATTTLACMDSFSRQLSETGYLHNHARMWFAAYIVHWRKIRWQAGAAWFLQHLIDGDPASNNLSWQWVASTFATKPYIFNRENLERYTGGVFCSTCPHAQARTCPFDREYETLDQTLFPQLHAVDHHATLPPPPRPFAAAKAPESSPPHSGKPLLWVHTDSLNPASPMLAAHPASPAVFLWDTDWLTRSRISLKRIVFLAECLQQMPGTLELRAGDPATELLAAAHASGADYILAQRTPDPRLLAAAAIAETHLPVLWYDPPPFVETTRPFDLKRFSRYWQRAQTSAMQPTRSS